MTSIRDRWTQSVRRAEEDSVRAVTSARKLAIGNAEGLRGLTDAELIATAPVRTSLSRADHEMEMQRRLKDSIEALTKETSRARWWAFWGTVAIGVLTAVLIALTVVLALKG